jgi:hypothetical protein
VCVCVCLNTSRIRHLLQFIRHRIEYCWTNRRHNKETPRIYAKEEQSTMDSERTASVACLSPINSETSLAVCRYRLGNSPVLRSTVWRQGLTFDNRFRPDPWIDDVLYSGLECDREITFKLSTTSSSLQNLKSTLKESRTFQGWVSSTLLIIHLYGTGQSVQQNP